MKKFLSLALALIMALSLVTVSAGATFTDAKAINNTEAVEVMAALGILEGSNGAFNPQGTLTRGAAAKIIAYMVEGTAKADAIKAAGVDAAPFSDVPTTSATAPFIAWAAEKGIVGGYSDGTFKRSNPVSGNAFVKMVLVALGVTDIDFTAKGWQVDAIARAVEMELLEGISDEVVFSANLARENAAQIAFNAMKYVPEGNKYWVVGDVKFDTATDAAIYAALTTDTTDKPEQKTDLTKSLAGKNYKLDTYTGIVTKNGATNAIVADAGKTVVGEKTFKFATGLELIGHKVTVYFNADTKAVYTICDESTTVKMSNKTTDKAALAAALDIDEDDVAASYSTTVYTGEYAADAGTLTVGSDGKATSGTVIIAYNEGTEEYEVIGLVKAATKYLDQVKEIITDEEEEAIELVHFGAIANGALNEDEKAVDAIIEYADIAEDDYVIVTVTGDKYTVEKAETITGKITKMDGTKLTVNGKAYSKNTNAKVEVENAAEELDFVTEYILYLDGTGKYIAVATEAGETNKTDVFFVAGYEKTAIVEDAYLGTYTETTYWAQCVNQAGEIVIYQTTDLVAYDNGLYTVELKEVEELDDGIEYAFFTEKGRSTDTDITAKALKVDGVYYFTDDVKFIAVEEKADLAKTKVTVKTGAQDVKNEMFFVAKAVKDADGVATGNYTVAYVFVNGKFETPENKPTDDVVYAIETKNSTVKVPYVKGSDTKTGFEHTVYIDGVKTTIVTTDAAKLTGFIKLTKVVDGVYTTAANGAENLMTEKVIGNKMGDMITITGEEKLEDINVSAATIVDLRDEDSLATGKKLVTSVSGLEKGMTLALVVDTTDAEAWTIATIYVVG